MNTCSRLLLICSLAVVTPNTVAEAIDREAQAHKETSSLQLDEYALAEIFQKITYGNATLEEVRRILSDTDIAVLTNTMHALYSMRWHRGVINLMDDIWALTTAKYPELAWKQLQSTPVRIALASTINRIQIFNTREFQDFIRSHKDDTHEFHRAQVVVSLGLNADPADVPYLTEMADGDNVYVSQSAITALGLMANEQSRNALIGLSEKYQDKQRGRVIREVLKKSYHWEP